MRKSTILWIIGGAVVGAAAYCVLKQINSKKEASAASTVYSSFDSDVTESPVSGPHSFDHVVAADVVQVRSTAVSSIRERHQEAAAHLKDTVEDLTAASAEFDEKSTRISDDLNELLK